MAYTTIDKPSDYFNTVLYTGNSSTQAIAVGFQSDWVWCKPRTNTGSHFLTDSVRGGTKVIISNTTGAEITRSSNIQSFTSTGYTLGADGTSNFNGDATVAWNWKAGTSFTNDASGTGIGSIDSAGSVNNDAGFSICSYTGTGSNGTVKHGLSTTPSTIIYKRRNSTSGWVVWHKSIGTNILELNETGAAQGGSSYINGTVPTSSVFSIGTSGDINADGGTYVAYCFNDVQGYSKFGSYTGNGTDNNGTFVYTGFKPAWLMVKRTDSTSDWSMYDIKREAANPQYEFDLQLEANDNAAEGSDGQLGMYSNGFKLRSSDAFLNASGGTYIYMAFAEQPFVTSTGVPATAR